MTIRTVCRQVFKCLEQGSTDLRYTSFVAFDLETTGLSPSSGARVIEIGAVGIENGVITGEFTGLVSIPGNIPPYTSLIHGITDDMLIGQPKPEDIFPRFREFIGDKPLIAHNVRFDAGFLRYEFGRLGLGLSNPGICTLEMSRRLLPALPNHKLETVARYLLGNLPKGTRLHRAMDDARLVAQIWTKMMSSEGLK